MEAAKPRPLVIVGYNPEWPQRFAGIGAALRTGLGEAAERIDHIGSTSVAALDAKDIIDVQVTVADLALAEEWPHELIPGVTKRSYSSDHVPPGADAATGEWAKRYWSGGRSIHVHVRQRGRANQRYALLFRDYLRADAMAAGAYAQLKWALVDVTGGDVDDYYAVKDSACDLIMAGAEQWARRTDWSPGPSDA